MANRTTQRLALRDAVDVDISDTPATTDVISQLLRIPNNKKWSLNVSFDSLAVTGLAPTLTIYVSNANDEDSIIPLHGANLVIVPEFFHKIDFPGEFMVVEYNSNGATAGTKFIDLFVDT